MNNNTENEKWLEILGSKDILTGEGDQSSLEAALIRRAFLRQIEQEIKFEPSLEGLNNILAEAEKQKIFISQSPLEFYRETINSLYLFLALPKSITASLVMIAVMAGVSLFQFDQNARLKSEIFLNSSKPIGMMPQATEMVQTDNPLRESYIRAFEANTAIQIVDNPETIAEKWEKRFNDKKIDYTIKFQLPDRIIFTLKVTPEASSILENENIISPTEQWLNLLIERRHS